MLHLRSGKHNPLACLWKSYAAAGRRRNASDSLFNNNKSVRDREEREEERDKTLFVGHLRIYAKRGAGFSLDIWSNLSQLQTQHRREAQRSTPHFLSRVQHPLAQNDQRCAHLFPKPFINESTGPKPNTTTMSHSNPSPFPYK